jgi:Cu/Ag efflux protein CusF
MLLAIVTLAAAGAVLARQAQPKPDPMAEKTFSGKVASVDADANTVTVKEQKADAPEQSMTFSVDEQTKIASRIAGSDKTLKLEDLESGDRVMVRYTVSAGKNIAEAIEVVSPGATSSH